MDGRAVASGLDPLALSARRFVSYLYALAVEGATPEDRATFDANLEALASHRPSMPTAAGAAPAGWDPDWGMEADEAQDAGGLWSLFAPDPAALPPGPIPSPADGDAQRPSTDLGVAADGPPPAADGTGEESA